MMIKGGIKIQNNNEGRSIDIEKNKKSKPWLHR